MLPERRHTLAWLLALLPAMCLAHQPSDSYLTLDLRVTPAQLRWDIALRDLEQAIGIDRNADRQISWEEVQGRHTAIAAYASARLGVLARQFRCNLLAGRQQLVDHSDGTYAVLPLSVDCAGAVPTALNYGLLFDIDPTHRGLLRVLTDSGENAHVLSPDQPRVILGALHRPGILQSFTDYLVEGVRHIWIGMDHILFLLTLLLPLGLRRPGEQRHAARSAGDVGLDVLSVVTAFTVAHSITLSLAVLQVVALPSQWVESAIAATVLIAAINNLRPFLPGRLWAVAFALGLVHGFGFASVLLDLGLPATATVIALAGFNLGVEIGQLAIVLLFVPLVYACRTSRLYRLAGVPVGSAVIAAIALVWLLERSLDLELLAL